MLTNPACPGSSHPSDTSRNRLPSATRYRCGGPTVPNLTSTKQQRLAAHKPRLNAFAVVIADRLSNSTTTKTVTTSYATYRTPREPFLVYRPYLV